MKWSGRIALTLVIGAVSVSAGALPSHKDCEAQLTGHASESARLSAELYELRQKLNEALYPFADPFETAITIEEHRQIFSTLLQKNVGPRTQPSILNEAHQFLFDHKQLTAAQLTTFLKKVVAEGRAQLKAQGSEKELHLDRQRAALAIEMVLPYAHALLPQPTAAQGQSAESNSKTEESPTPDAQVPPEYPEYETKEFKAETHDTQAGKTKAQSVFIAAEIKKPKVDFFYYGVHNDIQETAGGEFIARTVPLPMSGPKRFKPYSVTDVPEILNPQGKPDVPVLLPPGFEPLSPNPSTGASLYSTPDGQIRLRNPKGLQSIQLYLVKAHEKLNPLQIDFLSRPLNIRDDEWPREMQFELLSKIRGLDPLSAMRKAESYVANKFLYSVGERPEKNPIAAMNAGAFQCSMGAVIGVAIARNILHLPARALSGLRGMSSPEKPDHSYVVLPNDNHAEVEVYIGGEWVHFDFTPLRKDRSTQEDGLASEYKDVAKDMDEEFAPPPPSEKHDPADKKPAKDFAKKVKDDSQKRLKDGAERDQDGDKGFSEGEKTAALLELEKDLSMGSLTLQNEAKPGALIERARRRLLQEISNPLYDTATARQKLQRFQLDVRNEIGPKNLANRIDQTLTERQDGVPAVLFRLSATLRKRPLLDSFKHVVQVEKRLELHYRLSDAPEQKEIAALVKDIKKIKAEFSKLNQDDRIRIGRAEKFYRGLPPHTRRLVEQQFGLTTIGNNRETDLLYKAIGDGKLNDYNLIRVLYPLTNFVMDSTPTPAWALRKTVEEDSPKRRGRDLLPLTDFSRARQAVILNPNKSLVGNIIDGTAYVRSNRKSVKVPSPTGQTEPKRETILAFDTSGSMENEPGDFQAGLIAAFVDRALSDIGAGGLHRHLCELLGFDDKVHTAIPVRNSADAYEIIRHFRDKMKNTRGGTDIMAVLRESIAQINDAQKRAGREPLASANIILMSDGGSQIDFEEIKKLLASVNRKTPVRFMFVAINGTNPSLIDLTRLVRQAGAAESYYYEFSSGVIHELLQNASRPPEPNLDEELYTLKTAADLSPALEGLLSKLASDTDTRLNAIRLVQQPRDLDSWSLILKAIRAPKQRVENTPVGNELMRFRSWADASAVMRDSKDVEIIYDDLMKHFEALTGTPYQRLEIEDLASLKKTFEAARFYSKGSRR